MTQIRILRAFSNDRREAARTVRRSRKRYVPLKAQNLFRFVDASSFFKSFPISSLSLSSFRSSPEGFSSSFLLGRITPLGFKPRVHHRTARGALRITPGSSERFPSDAGARRLFYSFAAPRKRSITSRSDFCHERLSFSLRIQSHSISRAWLTFNRRRDSTSLSLSLLAVFFRAGISVEEAGRTRTSHLIASLVRET